MCHTVRAGSSCIIWLEVSWQSGRRGFDFHEPLCSDLGMLIVECFLKCSDPIIDSAGDETLARPCIVGVLAVWTNVAVGVLTAATMEHPANLAPLAETLLDPILGPPLFPEPSTSFYPIREVYNALTPESVRQPSDLQLASRPDYFCYLF